MQYRNIAITLVEAKNKTPFQEFVVGDKVFAKVKPGRGYFIAMRRIRQDESTKLVLKIFVNGEYMCGVKSHHIRSESSHYFGQVRRQENATIHKCLVFPNLEEWGIRPEYIPNGHIEIRVYEYVQLSKSQSRRVSMTARGEGQSMAEEGSTLPNKIPTRVKTGTYAIGKQVETFHLYYTTTGILPDQDTESLCRSSNSVLKETADTITAVLSETDDSRVPNHDRTDVLGEEETFYDCL